MTKANEELKEKQLETSAGGNQSSFLVAVPDIIGKMFIDAKNELQNLGFSTDCKYENSSSLKDTVLLSNPLPGTKLDKGSKVVLTLSDGRGE